MAETERFQETVRSLLRERILDAARDVVAESGWSGVRMSALAVRVGVSRQTLYNEFGSKLALGEALVMRENDAFLTGIREQLDARPGDVPEAIAAAVRYTLESAAENPLLRAILTATRPGAENLLPLFTTRSQPILDAATAMLLAYAHEHWAEVDGRSEDDVAFLADTVVRLTVSHIVLPLARPQDTARRVGRLARAVLEGVAPG
jgi:AcrR family transcriptional regulator